MVDKAASLKSSQAAGSQMLKIISRLLLCQPIQISKHPNWRRAVLEEDD